MTPTTAAAIVWPRFMPRWLAFSGMLLLTLVFSSQLYWSGYVAPWTRAFGQEATYWLSTGTGWP